MTVKLRYKQPDGDKSELLSAACTVSDELVRAGDRGDFKFAAASPPFGMLLRGSAQKGTASYDTVAELAGEGLSFDPSGWRKEFVDLVARAKALAAVR